MRVSPKWSWLVSVLVCAGILSSGAAARQESFDREPPNWDGVNNRNKFFEPKTVVQNFGYSATSRAGGGGPVGEIGGQINPAGEPAYYGYRLPTPLNLDSPMTAEGNLFVPAGSGHFLLGFFNTNTLNEWRTPNTLVARINNRGESFHCHLEYCTSRWRASAGVIGEIVQGERISAVEIPNRKVHRWKLSYDPNGAGGKGLLTFMLNNATARCEIVPEHRRAEGLTVTHFGLLPVLKTWDGAGEIWLNDVTINGVAFDFSEDPKWDGFNNRRTYVTTDTRPKFDFGWSQTHHAGGKSAGELGGLIFRGDCREPARMAAYGDRLGTLTLKSKLEARGKVAVLRAISDSTASIGFYHSIHSMQSNPSQKQSIPMDYVGINIEGPSGEGFFFILSIARTVTKALRSDPTVESPRASILIERSTIGFCATIRKAPTATVELPSASTIRPAASTSRLDTKPSVRPSTTSASALRGSMATASRSISMI